ncbi:Sodium-dependent neutral amino acid transporter B(0)AT3, partial [Armadillidium nasatum]
APLPYSVCPMEFNSTKPVEECELSSETAFFWYRQTIDASPSLNEFGGVKWWMALCLTLSWIVVWFCIMRGIQSSGKMTKLLDPMVWMDAACQVFYSLGLAFGSLIAFASYNPMNNNCKRDAIFMCCITVFTATFATIDIFAVLGFKAVANFEKCVDHNLMKLETIKSHLAEHTKNINITYDNYPVTWPMIFPSIKAYYENETHDHFQECSVAAQLNEAAEGTGLAFMVFTQAIVELPGSNFWSVCFFLMLLALGLGSQFGTMEGVITNLFDMKIFARVRKEVLTGAVCGLSLLIGLVFCTGAGEYWLGMFDQFAGSMGLIIIAFFELVVISYVYGHKKFSDDIQKMIGERPGLYWQAMWRFISPLTVFGIVTASVVTTFMYPPTYPAWDKETVSMIALLIGYEQPYSIPWMGIIRINFVNVGRISTNSFGILNKKVPVREVSIPIFIKLLSRGLKLLCPLKE